MRIIRHIFGIRTRKEEKKKARKNKRNLYSRLDENAATVIIHRRELGSSTGRGSGPLSAVA